MPDEQATIKIRYEGVGPLTVGHLAWYPGETWTVDPATLTRLQADGVALTVLSPMATLSGASEAQPTRRGRKAAIL